MILPRHLICLSVLLCACYYLFPEHDFTENRLSTAEETALGGAGWPNYHYCNVVSVKCTGGTAPGGACPALGAVASWCGGATNNERCDPSAWTDDCTGTSPITACPKTLVKCMLGAGVNRWTAVGGAVPLACGSYISCI